MSTEGSDVTNTVHLLVLIHGMWGNPVHLAELRRIMSEKRCQPESDKGPGGEGLRLLIAETNRDDGTYDGIDWGGERVAEEIFEEVKALEKEGRRVTRFSVTGYSLGGLIARYVVGILHQRGFFKDVTPVNLNTIATPNLGLLKYPNVVSSVAALLGPKLLSRTGEQFYVVDKWSKNGRPLLEIMADPDRVFFQGLSLFQHVRIYANAVNDVTVEYITAAIEEEDIFVNHRDNGMIIELDEKYSPVIKSYSPAPGEVQHTRPRPFSSKWFKNLKPNRPVLPPALQFRFPLNVILITLTPILLPLILSLVITRLALASRASRARIKVLEKDESNVERLVHVLGRLERQVEDVIVDVFDNSGSQPSAGSSQPLPSRTLSPGEGHKSQAEVQADLADAHEEYTSKDKVGFSETQRKMAAWLNSLPGLKKELAFIHPVRNSHAVIISRDPKRFPAHKQGEGVIRHWADHFIV